MNKYFDKKMPKLGFGLMRLPEKNGEIDIETVNKMVDEYIKSGFNYFDTAYVYHGGKSECVIKESLVKRYPRESFFAATKLPAWELKSLEDRDRIFSEQLKRAGLDYYDFYLLHSVEDGGNYNTYERLDCFNWAIEKKKEGLIKHFGFSYHGTPKLLKEILDKHPEVEFVQIQLNYADWSNQIVHSGELYNILLERNIPIIVMEPVKGGILANLDEQLANKLKSVNPEKSIASWAMRFAGSLPGVMTILSGMSSEEQVKDNIHTFTDFEPLTDEEKLVIDEIVAALTGMPMIQCTSCRYCTPGCPKNIQIPDVFRALNTKRLYPKDNRPHFFYNGLTADTGKAKDCIACGQCEKVCPQHLNIIELIKEASEKLDVDM